ncbi:MAG: hypothetical protein PHV98_00685 [Candidatus Omnitrophica bacterium]|nr:hypothetical protein [Candidatus Omnitrophota bacterium]
MRKQFVETLKSIMATDQRVVVILGDIGEYSFRDVFHDYPDRIYNVGISEQAMVGMASGLAKEGFIPIVHTISPFLIERAYEQIKIDIGYQKRKVILVGYGGSYDYSGCGATHHSPADVALIYNVPGMDIYIPGHKKELDNILNYSIGIGENPCYIRIGERVNKVFDGLHNTLVEHDRRAVIIAVGEMFDKLDEEILNKFFVIYINQVIPFPILNFGEISNKHNNQVIILEPYYPILSNEVIKVVDHPVRVLNIGVPRQFIYEYGKISDIDNITGLSVERIKKQIEEFLNE